ncbi:MAG: alpha-D-ribose 1-methylphosphonate 5-phosphate C-P-lyase PhnJ [Caldilineaceae bacterium]
MSLSNLASPQQDYAFGFLDEFAKRELRRRMLKAIAIPGYQVPYASRELPIAWMGDRRSPGDAHPRFPTA